MQYNHFGGSVMMGNNANCTKLSACALGVAFGITQGLGMMLLAWMAWKGGIGTSLVVFVSNLYHGYAADFVGGLFGFGWGFLDGFVFGVVAGFFYNLCLCCSCCKKRPE
jgi:hypothetical protein